MSALLLLAAQTFTGGTVNSSALAEVKRPQPSATIAPDPIHHLTAAETLPPRMAIAQPEIPATSTWEISPRPRSGGQLFVQRWAALRAGRLYTRLPSHSFQDVWSQAQIQPTYAQWKMLLAREAQAVANGQGNNRLSILIGDSLSLWLPTDGLPGEQLWLNQGISGDTTSGVLQRLDAFAETRPNTIYVMAGINDLRRGLDDKVILTNLRQIMQQLRANHPQARIIVQSILPTRYDAISAERIHQLNQQLAAIAVEEETEFLNLADRFTDGEGKLIRHLTTDGLHLNAKGYWVWQSALRQTMTLT